MARVLEHDVLLALGACSFEVFLFQWPVHQTVSSLFGDANASAEVFVLMCLALWATAATYIAHVDQPLAALLRKHTEQWGIEAPPLLALPPFARVPTNEEMAQASYGSTAASMV